MLPPVQNFSWLLAGRLAGMAEPGTFRPLDQDLQSLAERGVGLVVTLTERAVPPAALARHGLRALHAPIQDYSAPSQAQLLSLVRAIRAAQAAGQPVALHCFAGKGRTGTVLAACLVAEGQRGDEAIAAVRAARPGSIETAGQEAAVLVFEETWRRA